MKRFTALLSSILVPCIVSAADPATLRKVSGTVEVKAAKDAAWAQAQPGTKIPSGGAVRTGADGRAEMRFQNKASVWLKPSTSVALDQKGPKHNQLVLGSGAMKIRVPHLRRREKFEVKTPVAVASVRGTVFSVDADKVQTFFGQVDMKFDDGKKVKLPQGMSYNGEKTVLLSQMDEVLGLEDWTPGLSDDERRAGLVGTVESRQQIRDFADDALARNNEVTSAMSDKVKENDFAAGRTLVDAHGNLVRVEQRLDRPDPKTIQITNVTLRKGYQAGGLRTYAYTGTNHGPRIDALIARAEFNQDLPDQINAFPGYFSANEDALKIDWASMILANMTDADNIQTVAFLGKRVAASGTDDIKSDLFVGTLTDLNSRADARDELFSLRFDNAAAQGLTQYKETTTGTINSHDDGGVLHGTSAKQFSLDGTLGTTKIWLCTESFVINNAGRVRNVSDFTGGGANVLDLLSDSAGQSVVFVRNDNGSNAPGATDLLGGTQKNIDLVIIPDLFLSVAKSLATSMGELGSAH